MASAAAPATESRPGNGVLKRVHGPCRDLGCRESGFCLWRSIKYNSCDSWSIALQASPFMRLSRSVHFPLNPVTCVSRSPTSREYHILDAYECHTAACQQCSRARHRRAFTPPDLCQAGRMYSFRVGEYFFGGGNGHVYSTVLSNTKYFRVEMPISFVQIRRLLGQATLGSLRRQYRRSPGILSTRAKKSMADLPAYVLVVRSRKRR